MERQVYFNNNTTNKLIQSFPGSSQSDDVVITVFDADDSATDVNAVAMTAIGNSSWSYDWAVTEGHVYLIKFRNNTLDVEYFLYANVIGTATPSASGGSGGSTLTVLRNKFLKLIDNWNSGDLTGTNSAGEVADLCINDGLQLIYAQIKASKFMQAYGSTSLVSTSGQAYIALSAITDMDEIVSLKDTTNRITLIEIQAQEYFRQVPDPAQSTGTPIRYCRIFNRIYLDPRPTSAITYTTEYVKVYPRLAADADQALIDSKYDDWIMKEAHCIWMKMEDPASAGLAFLVRERDDAREIYINDIMSNFDLKVVARSHFSRGRRWRYWDSPIDGT